MTKRSLFCRYRGRQIGHRQSHPRRNADAVFRIGLVEMDKLPLDDLQRNAAHRCFDIVEELILLVRRHQPEQIARLPRVVVAGAVIVAVGGVSRELQRRLARIVLVLYRTVERVRLGRQSGCLLPSSRMTPSA